MQIQERQIKIGFGNNGIKPKIGMRYIIPPKEKDLIKNELSDSEKVLFNEYMERSLSTYNGQPLKYDDKSMAHATGWTITKVARVRRKLQKKHFIREKKQC